MNFRWEEYSGALKLYKGDDFIGYIKKSVEYYGKYYYIEFSSHENRFVYFDSLEICKEALIKSLDICFYKEISREEGMVVYEF